MNRIIKFRAWDYQNNGWAKNSDVAGSIGLEFSIKDHFINIAGEKALRFSFNQFTGLLDKNGVEIYEGDIVRDVTHRASGANYEIVFDKTGYRGVSNKGDKYGLYTLNLYINDKNPLLEIIGNIYANPELLNPQP